MERLRLLERKIIRKCMNYKRPMNSFKHISNNILYRKTEMERIDRFLIKMGLRFLDSTEQHSNNLVKGYYQKSINLPYDINAKFNPPYSLKHLKNSNSLYDDIGNLTFYHRRINTQNTNYVYNTNQNIN